MPRTISASSSSSSTSPSSKSKLIKRSEDHTGRRRSNWERPGYWHTSSAITLGWSEWPENKRRFFYNIFLRHDFHPSHGGKRDPQKPWKGIPGTNLKGCEGDGLMSYGRARPNAWSTCSNSDFENWYRTKGQHCLRSGAGGSGTIGVSGGIGICEMPC